MPRSTRSEVEWHWDKAGGHDWLTMAVLHEAAEIWRAAMKDAT